MGSEAKSPASSAADPDVMPDPIRLLVVDDAIEHARMVVEFLRSGDGWPDADMKIAASYDEALEAFAAQPFDVAFFDYWLGARDGLSLLRDIRRRGVETPVIVLTSRGAEEVAVDAMKAGAADYLSKAALSVEALERAIRYALALHAGEQQRWHAEAALRASEERFRALVENSSDALLLVDAEGRITYLTPSSERHLGWPSNEMVGRSIFDVIHPHDRELVSARMAETLSSPLCSVSEDIELVTILASDLLPVRVDPASVEQILVNLAVNARDAMPLEDAVRALAREVLRRYGYVVLEARHGVDALRVAARHPDDIHLMVTDVVMPHMNGREAAERLTTGRPTMKVLFMSGYTDHALMHRELAAGEAFIQKPYTPEVLARKVRQVLDSSTVRG